MEEIVIKRDIRFVNVGEMPPHPKPGSGWVERRQWKACIECGFLSAGQALIYNRPLLKLKVDDVVAAYITGAGYVGIGTVEEEAKEIRNFKFNGRTVADFDIDKRIINGTLVNDEVVEGYKYLRKSLFCNSDNEKSEYAVGILWKKVVGKEAAYWERNSGLFAKPVIQCTLRAQRTTIKFLEKKFGVKFKC